MPPVQGGNVNTAKTVPGNPSVQPPAIPPGGPINYPPFIPPPPSGSSGPEGVEQGPILTPYGGIYPQPLTQGAFSQQQAAGLLGGSSIAWRPQQNIKIITLSFLNIAPATTSLVKSGVIPTAFTIRDILIYFDNTSSESNMQIGTSSNNLTVAELSANILQSNLILSQSRRSDGAILGCIIAMTPAIAIYNLNTYVNSRTSYVYGQFLNAGTEVTNAQIIMTIEMEPGSETVP